MGKQPQMKSILEIWRECTHP